MEPLHQRIRADVERKILSGEWPPGHRIPFEHEFLAEYSCSRMTVNKVLSGLAAAGLIERRRKAGSFVARPRIQSAVLDIPDLEAEILGRGEAYRYELLSARRRQATRVDGLAFAEAEPPGSLPIGGRERGGSPSLGRDDIDVLDLTCRHFAGETPFVLEERLINLDAVPEAAAADFSARPPGTWLLEHVPWTDAEHRIVAVNAGKAYAGPLGVAPETACMLVERRTWREGRTITRVRQIFPGNLYSMTARFTPAGR
jgi:GntR family histidine utilization transcriptional repressor